MGTIESEELTRENELDVEGEALIYRSFRHFWHPVIYSHDLHEDPVRVELCGELLVVVRLEGQVAVFDDLCAHRGTALSLGSVVRDGTALRCPYHGWEYGADGRCTHMPQRPDLARRLRTRISKRNAVERYGMVWVCLADEPHFPLPEFTAWDDPDYDKVFLPATDWRCSAPRRTENYMDLAHFSIVHDGLLGFSEHPEVPEHSVWREDSVLRMSYATPVQEPRNPVKRDAGGGTGSTVLSHKSWQLFMPLTVLLRSEADGSIFYLFFHPTPVGPKQMRNFTIGARNYGSKDTIYRDIVEFNEVVYDQDKPIVESQRPEQLPEDLSAEMHLAKVDTLSVNYRKWLVEIARELAGADGR